MRVWNQLSNEEFIEKCRRDLQRFDRFRWPLLGFYASLAAVYVTMIAWLVRMLEGLGKAAVLPMAGLGSGVIIGIMLGMGFGVTAHTILFNVLNLIRRPRAESLLVWYHDALQGFTGDAIEPETDVSGDLTGSVTPGVAL